MNANNPRRLRGTPLLREMVRETRMSAKGLVQPIFIREGSGIVEDIPSLSGQKRYSPDTVCSFVDDLAKHGVESVLLFGLPNHKDDCGTTAHDNNGVVQQAVREIKKLYPDVFVITDVCLCEYTSHGHCGILTGERVDNAKTLPILAKTALSHVQAGADMVAPSDMMDGRVAAIRATLNEQGFAHTPIMSYAVKYASAFYEPFREAASSAPAFGDRKTYQMDYHNAREAVKEALLDIDEGADIVMVKPAMSYLDIISKVSDAVNIPVAAYSVSGEYAMIKATAQAGLLNEYKMICETATSVFRAGANILCTYFAKEIADAIKRGDIG